MKTIKVLPLNWPVTIGSENDPIHGNIHEICIRGNGKMVIILYLIRFWAVRERKEIWVGESEIRTNQPPHHQTIGFK